MLRSSRRFSAVKEALRGRDLSGKAFAITGAEAGLGLTTAVALATSGAKVFLACADGGRGQEVADALNKQTGKNVAWSRELDLGSRASIQKWSAQLEQHAEATGETLDGLVHHAGVMGLGQYMLSTDKEEMQWAMNCSGAARLTHCLWDIILRHGTKVLCLTSTSHCKPDAPLDFSHLPGPASAEAAYHGWAAYQQSKLASILVSNELNRQFSMLGSGASSIAVCESDKWFIMPRLLLDEDKKELEPGPVTSIEALLSDSTAGYAGKYLVDAKLATPSDHATCEASAKELWRCLTV